MINIREAKYSEIKVCANILISAAKRINQTGSLQWEFILKQNNEEYLTEKLLEKKLYVFVNSKTIIGICTLLAEPEQWDIDLWQINSFDGYFLHRFALADDFIGKGYSKVCLEALQQFASSNNKAIRLDCLKEQTYLNQMYQSVGFKKVGFGEHLTPDNYLFSYNLYEWSK